MSWGSRSIVVRFPLGGFDQVKKVLDEARRVNRRHQSIGARPWYRLSVWADTPRRATSAEGVVLEE